MLTWLVAAAIGVMLLFPQSPKARALQRLLVERPAGALNRLRRTHWLLGLAIVLVAVAAAAMGRELFLVFAQGTPELIAWIAAFDIATYADAFAAALLVATAVRLKPVLAAVRGGLQHLVRPRAARALRRPARRRKPPADPDGEPWPATLAFA